MHASCTLEFFGDSHRRLPVHYPKPWFRKQTGSWYVQLNGRQINLGPDRKAAHEMLQRLLGGVEEAPTSLTAHELLAHYCDWMEGNRAPSTVGPRRRMLDDFQKHIPKSLKASALRPHHVQQWLNPKHSSTTRSDRITTIKTVWNWAVSMGYLASNPIARMPKPRRQIRQDFVPSDLWEKVLDLATDDQFRDWLRVMLLTGARTQEMLRFEAKHFDGFRLILPIEDSKGRRQSRVVYLPDATIPIVEQFAKLYPIGPLFRTKRGKPWDRNSIRCRFRRLKRLLKMPSLCATTLRHSYAHHRLVSGQDALTVSKLMGHVDTRMLATRYGHLEVNTQFMRDAANFEKAEG